MPGKLDLVKDEIRFLEELERNGVRFIIVGLGAAAMQGAPMVTEDVDIWFEHLRHTGIQTALKAVGGSLVHPIDTGFLRPPMFTGSALQRFDIVVAVHGVRSFADEYRRAQLVQIGRSQVRVMPLDRIIQSKAAADRLKDRMALPALKDALKALRALQRRGNPRRKR